MKQEYYVLGYDPTYSGRINSYINSLGRVQIIEENRRRTLIVKTSKKTIKEIYDYLTTNSDDRCELTLNKISEEEATKGFRK